MRINLLLLPSAIFALLPALLMHSCCPCRRVGAATSDSLRIETRVRYERVRDTVFVAMPRESERVVVRDTASHLETSFAISDAIINVDGSLTHTLSNRDVRLPTAVDRVIEVRDSIVWRERTVTQTVETPRPLTRWQRLRMHGFWVLLAVAALLLRVCVKKF